MPDRLSDNQRLIGWGLLSAFLYFCLALTINLFSYLDREYVLTSVFLTGLFLSYFLVFQFFKTYRWQKSDFKIVLAFGVVFILMMGLMIPGEYNDFYHYFFEDLVIVKYQQNPYFIAPVDLPQEPLAWLSGWQLLPAQHGPVRFLMTLPAAWFGRDNIAVGIFLYKIIFGLTLFLSTWLVYLIANQLNREKSIFIYLLFAWNPLVLFGTFAGGGTDILMTFWALLAVYLTMKQRPVLAIAALTFSVLVKYVTILLLPLFLIYFWRRHPGLKNKIKTAATQLAVFTLAVVLTFAPFWRGVETLAGVIWVGRFFDVNSFPGLVSIIFYLVSPTLNWYSLKIIFEIFFVGLYLLLMLKLWTSKKMNLTTLIYFNVVVLAWFLLLGKFWFYPKYLIWLLPLMFLAGPHFYPLAVFLTGIVIVSPYSSILMPVAMIVPTLVFSFYYFLRRENKFRFI